MKRSRIPALLVAAIMLAATLGAFTSGAPDNMNEEGLPIAKEMTTFTVMMYRDEADGPWDTLEVMKWLEEVTNVHFEYDS